MAFVRTSTANGICDLEYVVVICVWTAQGGCHSVRSGKADFYSFFYWKWVHILFLWSCRFFMAFLVFDGPCALVLGLLGCRVVTHIQYVYH